MTKEQMEQLANEVFSPTFHKAQNEGMKEVLNNPEKYGLTPVPVKLYKALYCGCVHESSYDTISVHLTKEGAEKAIQEHRLNLKNRFINIYGDDKYMIMEGDPAQGYVMWDEYEDWSIEEIKLKL